MNSYLGAVVNWAPFWHATIVTALCIASVFLLGTLGWMTRKGVR